MKTWATSDFYLACFLKAKGLELANIEREGRRSVFIFKECPDRENLIKEYYNKGIVEVNAYKNAINDLKSIVFNL